MYGQITDIDECFNNVDNCLQECTNTDGGYSCSCSSDYRGTGNDCTGKHSVFKSTSDYFIIYLRCICSLRYTAVCSPEHLPTFSSLLWIVFFKRQMEPKSGSVWQKKRIRNYGGLLVHVNVSPNLTYRCDVCDRIEESQCHAGCKHRRQCQRLWESLQHQVCDVDANR